MIFKNGKELAEIYHGTLSIEEMYRGKVLIWQAARSCFGKGYWIGERPWLDNDAWKN